MRKLINGFFFDEKRHKQNRKNRADGAKTYQTEAVVLRGLAAAYRSNTYSESKYERHRDRSRGNAAGIKPHGKIFRLCKGGNRKNNKVKNKENL